MKNHLLFAAAFFGISASISAATVGQMAPAFTLKDTEGKTVNLADFKGKTVVLEWVNPGCPYVRKHYDAKNMQGSQQLANDKGAIWLAINSTAATHQDYLEPAKLAGWMKSQNARASRTLMDQEGTVGKSYNARTTPHMYIIDAKGTLVYAGGIDSIASANKDDISKATNFVNVSLTEVAAGKSVSIATTKPYGCSVKYK